MAHQHDHDHGREDGADPAAHHHHDCGNLFGCGDEKGTGIVREDLKEAAYTPRRADRLLHGDELDQENLDGYLAARGRARRQLLRASSFMGALAAVGPAFAKLAQAAAPGSAGVAARAGAAGRVHTVESTKETVRLGVFDTTVPPILTVDSGDIVSLPNTWSH